MKGKNVAGTIVKKDIDILLQNVLDILEAEDGRPFDEKRELAVSYLKEEENRLAGLLADTAEMEAKGQKIRDAFWKYGDLISAGNGIELRRVQVADREDYIQIRRIYMIAKLVVDTDTYWDMIWKEHIGNKSIMFSIFRDGEYAGYCGTNQITQEPWEIAIELRPDLINQGIGFAAMTAMLKEMKQRLHISEYNVLIEPTNYASQRLFEKLGAVPNGVSMFLEHDEQFLEECEEENLHLINDALISVAERFSVQPRQLLSHVLKYKLVWE